MHSGNCLQIIKRRNNSSAEIVLLDVLADWPILFICFGKTLIFDIKQPSFITSLCATQSPLVTVMVSVFRLSSDVCAHICEHECAYWE